jgi:hypothetical protein
MMGLFSLSALGQTTAFDGVYEGQVTRPASVNSPGCDPERPIKWVITNGLIPFHWRDKSSGKPYSMDTYVNDSGSFHQTLDWHANYGPGVNGVFQLVLTGQISQGVISARLQTQTCRYQYTLRKVSGP